jgi:hypothetical protein
MRHGRLYEALWMLMNRRRVERVLVWLGVKDSPAPTGSESGPDEQVRPVPVRAPDEPGQ